MTENDPHLWPDLEIPWKNVGHLVNDEPSLAKFAPFDLPDMTPFIEATQKAVTELFSEATRPKTWVDDYDAEHRSIIKGNGFAIRRLKDYDDEYLREAQANSFVNLAFPVRTILGIDPADIDADTLEPGVLWQVPEAMTLEPGVLWQVPEAMTLEMRNVSLETMEIVLGMPLIPLCKRRIPAEGQE